MAVNTQVLKEAGLVSLGGIIGVWGGEELDKYIYPMIPKGTVPQNVAGGAIVGLGALLLLMFFKNKGFDEILLGMTAGGVGLAVSEFIPLF